MEISKIVDHLYQGSKPEEEDLPTLKNMFDVLVLAAANHQLEDASSSMPIVRVPLNDYPDAPITEEEKDLASTAGSLVAEEMSQGKDVLVTCVAGLNRSGLISALALMHGKKGLSPQAAVKIVQRARPNALFNKSFISFLENLPTSPQEK